MYKGPPKDDLTEESEKQDQEDDTVKQDMKMELEGKKQDSPSATNGIHKESRMLDMLDTEKGYERQHKEDKLYRSSDEFKSGLQKLDSSWDGQENESEEPSTMEKLPSNSLNEIEALNEDTNPQIQDKPKEQKSSDCLKRKLLALEQELSIESIQSKTTIEIFFPSAQRPSECPTEIISQLPLKPERKGLSSKMAILFIVSAATGSAFVSLPYHLRESTWFGIFFLLLLGLNSLYACLCAGWCWSTMEEIWPEYLEWSRTPYQDIAYRVTGKWMKYIVAFLIEATIFILCGNYIISISEIMGEFLYPDVTACYFIIIATLYLSFFAMLGSYTNVKFIGAADVLLSLVVILFIIICLFFDQSIHGSKDYSKSPDESVFAAFAGMSHAFGIGIIVPNIISEMNDRNKFTEACVTAHMIILAIYTVLSILGYAAYGSKTPENITRLILKSKYLKRFGVAINILHSVQLATTFIIFFIPLALVSEDFLSCPNRFCLRRVTIRAVIMLFIMLIILGFPSVFIYMDFIASTSLNIISFILPPILYVYLIRQEKAKTLRRKHSLKEIFLALEIILLGIVIAAAAIPISIKLFIGHPHNFVSCYLNMSSHPLR